LERFFSSSISSALRGIPEAFVFAVKLGVFESVARSRRLESDLILEFTCQMSVFPLKLV
jgi:hypothetical protein